MSDTNEMLRATIALQQEQLDRFEDLADEDTFNRALWLTIKGPSVPYPGIRRISGLDLKRSL